MSSCDDNHYETVNVVNSLRMEDDTMFFRKLKDRLVLINNGYAKQNNNMTANVKKLSRRRSLGDRFSAAYNADKEGYKKGIENAPNDTVLLLNG